MGGMNYGSEYMLTFMFYERKILSPVSFYIAKNGVITCAINAKRHLLLSVYTKSEISLVKRIL